MRLGRRKIGCHGGTRFRVPADKGQRRTACRAIGYPVRDAGEALRAGGEADEVHTARFARIAARDAKHIQLVEFVVPDHADAIAMLGRVVEIAIERRGEGGATVLQHGDRIGRTHRPDEGAANRIELGEGAADTFGCREDRIDAWCRHAVREQRHFQVELCAATPQRARTRKSGEIEEVGDRLRSRVAEAPGRIGNDLCVDDAADPAWAERIWDEVALRRRSVRTGRKQSGIELLKEALAARRDRVRQFQVHHIPVVTAAGNHSTQLVEPAVIQRDAHVDAPVLSEGTE